MRKTLSGTVAFLVLSTLACGDKKPSTLTPDASVPQKYNVGGTVIGLVGSVVLRNNGGDDLTVTANGTFTFKTMVDVRSAYLVQVAQQPTTPSQTCVVTATGEQVLSDVTDVAVVCSTNRFAVSGTLTGLLGGGLVLQNNDADSLTVAANGKFTFPTSVASGATFTVKVAHQPEGPSQKCDVSGSSGTIAGADVSSVVINCATNRFIVSGTIAGLAGTGLELQNNGGEVIAVSANGMFAFPTSLVSGGAFAVTVSTQPGAPTQTCAVSAGVGTVVAGNVTAVDVACTTNSYVVGGSVSGLAGSGLVLQNNLGDNLVVAADGTFSFVTKVPSSGAFSVTVLAQPTVPSQTCVVAGGAGLLVAADKADVNVNCTTDQHLIGGTVTGLVGAGLILRDNGGDDLTVTADGAFTFATKIRSGAPFLVTIVAQPSGPTQTCNVVGASGNVGAGDVSSVTVDCLTNAFTVSGTVAGLAGTGLAVALNGGTPTTISANGTFAFPTVVASGATYAVTITSSPTAPWQTCSVTGGSGAVDAADVTTVGIACVTNTYAVSGTVTGLAGTGLVLTNSGENVPVSADGGFAFPTAVVSGATYAVSVVTQPSARTQTCTVSGGTGVVAGGAIVGVAITCVTRSYQINGTISGLAGQLVLSDNGNDPLVVNTNGALQFGLSVASGDAFNVTVTAQPATPDQTCTITGGTGTVAAADIGSVVIACVTNTFTVGGTVTGLLGAGLTLQNNAGDNKVIAASGTFVFAQPVASGAGYVVTVATQPTSPAQSCVVTGGSGAIGGDAVTGVTVNCTTSTYTVGGTVSGLAGSGLVLHNSDGSDRTVSGNGSFAFAAPVASGATYLVTVGAQPTTPWQTCSVSAASGTVGATDVSNVAVTCVTNAYDVTANVTDLAGSGLVLQNKGGDNLAVANDGRPATFATKVLSGASYDVTVLTQPTTPWQTCTATAQTGVVAGAAVGVSVACTTNSYAVSGTVIGMAGTGLVIRDNDADALTIDANGTFTFPVKVASGAPYAVTISTQPTGPGCTLTLGSGTIAGANITNVAVTCGLPLGPANQCDYMEIGAFMWDNLGSMPWKACVVEAAKRGALLASEPQTALQGWGSHRVGANAQYVTTIWNSLATQAITNNLLCIVARDPRATTYSSALASTVTYDGQVWHYQDFGMKYYDECQLLASNAGAMVITPFTIGSTGANYWITPQHACNEYQWIGATGLSQTAETPGFGGRSSIHACMIGYVEF